MPAARTARDLNVSTDPWPVVEEWAPGQGYKLIEQDGDRRLYKKGSGFLTGIRKLELRKTGTGLHLEAWVAANLLARIMSLFILPPEITLESGGPKAILPRKLGRDEVNALLTKLGQDSIT